MNIIHFKQPDQLLDANSKNSIVKIIDDLYISVDFSVLFNLTFNVYEVICNDPRYKKIIKILNSKYDDTYIFYHIMHTFYETTQKTLINRNGPITNTKINLQFSDLISDEDIDVQMYKLYHFRYKYDKDLSFAAYIDKNYFVYPSTTTKTTTTITTNLDEK